MKYKILTILFCLTLSFFVGGKVHAYQAQLDFSTGVSFSNGNNRGLVWTDWTGQSSNIISTITLALSGGSDGSAEFWKMCCWDPNPMYKNCSEIIGRIDEADFYTFTWPDGAYAENNTFFCILSCVGTDCGSDEVHMFGSSYESAPQVQPYGDGYEPVVDLYFEILTEEDEIPTTQFEITSHHDESPAEEDTWITVTGTCPIAGENRIGLTNDCLGFENIEYNISCVDDEFSGQFFKSSLSDRLIARDIDSVSGDCVDYDDLMDKVDLRGIEIIEGYPDDWYFNFDYYDDYDIKIKSPEFSTALTLPIGSTSAEFTFGFIYPTSSTLSNLNFNINQYDEDGNLLHSSYHNQDLSSMLDTWNYSVTLPATSTQSLHYVVQLTDSGEIVRQYPFGIYVSDMDFTYNPDDFGYFFPRLVEMLRTKIVFNYYFAFHDGFYNMFNGAYPTPSVDDLDIAFKSVSGDGEYDIDIKIFSASDERVQAFSAGIRPYVVAILWLVFATYIVFRVTHLFSDNQ